MVYPQNADGGGDL